MRDPKLKTTVVQVGANDGSEDTSDDPLQANLGARNMVSLLCEPNPPVFANLKKNIRRRFPKASIQLANRAICSDRSGNVSFYTISPRFIKEWGGPHWMQNQLSSMDRTSIEIHHKVIHQHMGNRFTVSQEQFNKDYIAEIQVQCSTPADLLKDFQMSPRTVDILEVDAEGLDARIVSAFLQVPEFEPRVISWERHRFWNESKAFYVGPGQPNVIELLLQRGYKTNCVKPLMQEGCGQTNVVAVKQ